MLILNDLDWKKIHYAYKNIIMNYSYKNKVLNNTIKIIDENTILKVAIITGGCGLLGWEHALALRELNYKIVILDNSQKDLKKRVIENKKFQYKFDIIKCDITKKIKLFKIIKRIIKKYKNIDVLINNASIDYVPKKYSKTNNNFLIFDYNRWI